jgi:hypothetical protein
MEKLTTKILEHLTQLPEGSPVSAKELLHLGARAAVDQSLSRLVRRGQLMRAGRGRYVRPVETRFGKRPPSVEATAEALANSRGEVIAPSGAASANALGLTTQVPVKAIYLTSGKSRQVTLEKQTIEFRHAPAWQLLPGAAGNAIRALAWIGPHRQPEALPMLQRLPSSTAREIAGARARMPTWLAETVSRVFVNAG